MENNQNNEPESFIIQNVTLGHHYISDIRLQFEPLGVIDLTWEDTKIVKASKDLRNSIRQGLLKQITPAQWETILDKQSNKERRELLAQQKKNAYQTMEVDGKQLQVETLDANKTYNQSTEVSTAGYANDSLSYAVAFDIAQMQSEMNGEELSAEEFAEKVQQNPALVPNLLAQQKNLAANSSSSGKRSAAYVAQAPSEAMGNTEVQKLEMTNMSRDNYIAGGDFQILDAIDPDGDLDPIADVIDLEFADDEGSEKGTVRRV